MLFSRAVAQLDWRGGEAARTASIWDIPPAGDLRYRAPGATVTSLEVKNNACMLNYSLD